MSDTNIYYHVEIRWADAEHRKFEKTYVIKSNSFVSALEEGFRAWADENLSTMKGGTHFEEIRLRYHP